MDRWMFSRREAASALSVSLRTIDGLVADCTLPVLRLGKRVLIPKKSLDEFAAKARPNEEAQISADDHQ